LLDYSFTGAGEWLVDDSSSSVELSEVDVGRVKQIPIEAILLHAIPDRIVEARVLAGERRLAEAESWAGRYGWDQRRHQVGGIPGLVHRIMPNPECGFCGRTMPFLAVVVVEITNGFESKEHELQLLYFLCRYCANVAARADLPSGDYS
jgi:hypothetical protein